MLDVYCTTLLAFALYSSTANSEHTVRVPYLNFKTPLPALCLPCVDSHSVLSHR